MASDQSETSGGSRVRQFGLYRSIDARTEEFLRLSRKRQMRQGCACAAISTAITVTIIVSILLVFEFNVIPNAELKSMQYLKSLLNDTAEVMTLNKGNLNIDKATLKMLPMLMKALKKNNILHNTIEDTTKHSVQEGWHTTTEFTYKKNVFSDRNNWIRFPTSKAYAIEYKTSPVVYFKTPKNDYFTKIRKIRDYERIINYMDKMISDRVSFGSTQPMQTVEDYAAEEIQTERTFTMSAKRSSQVAYYPYESPMPKTIITTTRRPNVKIEGNKHCKCPKKIGQILNNLLSNIKLLVTQYGTTESAFPYSPCDIIEAKLHFPGNIVDIHVNEKIDKQILNQDIGLQPHIKLDLEAKKPEPGSKSNQDGLKQDQNLNNIFGLLQQKIIGQRTYLFKSPLKNVITTPPMFIERTEVNEDKSTTSRERYAKYDPLHFITTKPDTEEDNDKKMPQEKILSTSTSRAHRAKYNPLDFISVLSDYGENTKKIHNQKISSEKVVLTSTSTEQFAKYDPLHFIAVTQSYGDKRNQNIDQKVSSERSSSMSTSRIQYAQNDPLHFITTVYEEDSKKNHDNETTSEKTNKKSDEGLFSSSKTTAEKYFNLDINSMELVKKKLISLNKDMNNSTIEEPYTDIEINDLSTKPDTKWYTRNKTSESKNKFNPIVTTHYFYHRHNASPKFTSSAKFQTTTKKTTSPSKNATSVKMLRTGRTTKSVTMETTNSTKKLNKTIKAENNLSRYNEKYKEELGLRWEELNLDDDIDKMINGDNYQEIDENDDFRRTVGNMLEFPSEDSVFKNSGDVKEKDDVFFTSGAFHNKPHEYLEIQKNNLKQDETYDIYLKQLFENMH